MLYTCTHMAIVGVEGLEQHKILVSNVHCLSNWLHLRICDPSAIFNVVVGL